MSPGAPLLTLRDVRVEIGGSKILHGVGFDVAATGVTALLGRNGVGKTSTLLAVLGLVPRSGDIRFDTPSHRPRPDAHRSCGRGSATCPRTGRCSPA